jgi:ferrous iron transport protein A
MTTLAAFGVLPASSPTIRTLADVPMGRRARVGRVLTPGPLGERLMELGLTPGTEVDVLPRSFFGGHMRLGLRGSILPLHLDQARDVEVIPLP